MKHFLYLVVASFGYDTPEYIAFYKKTRARQHVEARAAQVDLTDGSDTIDFLRVDLSKLTVERWNDQTEKWDPV